LLFFVTYFNGVFIKNVLEKWMGIPLAANPFETFVLGLVTAFVYFNLLSFILPVNYLSLLPLLLLSGWTFAQAKERQRFFVQGANALRVFASPAAFILLAAFLAVFFVYWIILLSTGTARVIIIPLSDGTSNIKWCRALQCAWTSCFQPGQFYHQRRMVFYRHCRPGDLPAQWRDHPRFLCMDAQESIIGAHPLVRSHCCYSVFFFSD